MIDNDASTIDKNPARACASGIRDRDRRAAGGRRESVQTSCPASAGPSPVVPLSSTLTGLPAEVSVRLRANPNGICRWRSPVLRSRNGPGAARASPIGGGELHAQGLRTCRRRGTHHDDGRERLARPTGATNVLHLRRPVGSASGAMGHLRRRLRQAHAPAPREDGRRRRSPQLGCFRGDRAHTRRHDARGVVVGAYPGRRREDSDRADLGPPARRSLRPPRTGTTTCRRTSPVERVAPPPTAI